MRQVGAVAVRRGRGRPARAADQRSGTATSQPAVVAGLVQVARCGRARSAPGTRRHAPSTSAAATQVRSIAAASSGRAGEAIDQARDVAQHADRVVVVEVAAEALLVAVAGDAHHHRVAVLPVARRTAASPPRRAAGPRRCAGRRGTGSPGSAAARTAPAPSARPRIGLLVEQRVEDPGRAEPLAQPAGDAVDAALAADVLAEHQRAGVRRQHVGSARLIDWASVSGRWSSGSRPPDAAACAGSGRARPPGDGIGRRRRERRHRPRAAEPSRGASATSSASACDLGPRVPRTAPAPRPGCSTPASTSSRAVASSGSRPTSARDRPPRCGRPPPRRSRRGPSAGRCAGAGTPARRCCADAVGGPRAPWRRRRPRSQPSAAKYRRPGAVRRSACSIQPVGRRHADAEPVVLADQQQRQRQPLVARCWTAALIAPVAVEWLAEASPKLHTTIASAGHARRHAELPGAARSRTRRRARAAGGRRSSRSAG